MTKFRRAYDPDQHRHHHQSQREAQRKRQQFALRAARAPVTTPVMQRLMHSTSLWAASGSATAVVGIIAPMSKLRVAVVGVGYLGRFHAQKYASLEECELLALADPDSAAVTELSRELGTRGVANYRELLGKVDAVSVATPTGLHFEVAHAFLEAGAHVLVEKP